MHFVQVTAEYAQAVLLAILLYLISWVSWIFKRPPLPLTTNQIAECRCDSRAGHVGDYVRLTNRMELSILKGPVADFRAPKSFFDLKQPNLVDRYFGTVRRTQEEAVALARTNLVSETFAAGLGKERIWFIFGWRVL